MLAYSDEGVGPPILFAHGISADRTRWAPVTELLADSFRCVRVDLPGHGGSPDDGCDALSAAGQLAEVIDALRLERPVVVGHSLGANTALLHGALHAPAGVIAVDPVPLFLPHMSDSLAPYVERMLGDDFEAAFREWEAARFPLDQLPPERQAAIRQHTNIRPSVALSYWSTVLSRDTAEATQSRFAAALAAITAPTLICFGDPPTPEDRIVLDGMGSATVEVWEGMGHFLHLVDPPRFAGRVRAFVEALS